MNLRTLSPSREIDGKGRTVRELLAGRKYSIDYYQREYKWRKRQVAELIADLAGKFLDSHEEGNERTAVADYGHYFLGSIIVSDKDGQKYIIDGQQRLTTLTLLLTFLLHQLDDEQNGQIADLIFSQKYGDRSFNLDIPERTACMDSLYNGEEFLAEDGAESIVNLLARYADIGELFPEELQGATLPYFVGWLVENVHLVEITAYSDGDAYAIFETMNDRGLSLTPVDMLKEYLLANIADGEKRTGVSRVWKERVGALLEVGKDEDADGIKSWLRSQYAQSIRDRKSGAAPQDFDLIGTEFQRWVRDNRGVLGLTESSDFARFIERDFAFYSKWYERLRRAAETLTPGLECVHFNAQHNFTLQYPVLLAPLRVTDDEVTVLCKLRLVATYIDILIHRRIWNWRSNGYSTMQYAMFLVMCKIRGKDATELTVESLCIPVSSGTTGTASAASCFCRRVSMRATATCPTPRSASTTSVRTCSRGASTRGPTTATRAFGASLPRVGFRFRHTKSSRKRISMPARSFTNSLPSRSGIRSGSSGTPCATPAKELSHRYCGYQEAGQADRRQNRL
jgi:hypothetical protein